MYWYRLEVGPGRNGVVGATPRRADPPEHLPADERHQTRAGAETYIAATVGGGRRLGAALAPTADADDSTAAYGAFGQEARTSRKTTDQGRSASTAGPRPIGRGARRSRWRYYCVASCTAGSTSAAGASRARRSANCRGRCGRRTTPRAGGPSGGGCDGCWSGGRAGRRRAAESGGAARRSPPPRRLAPEPPGFRVPGWFSPVISLSRRGGPGPGIWTISGRSSSAPTSGPRRERGNRLTSESLWWSGSNCSPTQGYRIGPSSPWSKVAPMGGR